MTDIDFTPPKSFASRVARRLIFLDAVAADIRDEVDCSHEISQQAALLLYALHTLTSDGTSPWIDMGQDIVPACFHAVVEGGNPDLMLAMVPLTSLPKSRHDALIDCLRASGRLKKKASRYGGQSVTTVGDLLRHH